MAFQFPPSFFGPFNRLISKPIVVIMTAVTVTACVGKQTIVTQQANDGSNPGHPIAYERLLEIYSAGDSEYTGFYNNFEYRATLLNTPVREAQLIKQTQYYQWDQGRVALEREKMTKELGEETKVFMSFFTPDRQNDNLTNAKSIWRVYLDVEGRRYEGKMKRLRNLLAELQALYPSHTRWTTPYEVTFPVAATAIENKASTYTVTGPLGTRTVSFPERRH